MYALAGSNSGDACLEVDSFASIDGYDLHFESKIKKQIRCLVHQLDDRLPGPILQ